MAGKSHLFRVFLLKSHMVLYLSEECVCGIVTGMVHPKKNVTTVEYHNILYLQEQHSVE